jgi:hypothetical protein
VESKNRTETYRGHELAVSAFEQRRGVWTWTYVIDGTDQGFSAVGATLPTAEAALRRGMLAARARADELG